LAVPKRPGEIGATCGWGSPRKRDDTPGRLPASQVPPSSEVSMSRPSFPKREGWLIRARLFPASACLSTTFVTFKLPLMEPCDGAENISSGTGAKEARFFPFWGFTCVAVEG